MRKICILIFFLIHFAEATFIKEIPQTLREQYHCLIGVYGNLLPYEFYGQALPEYPRRFQRSTTSYQNPREEFVETIPVEVRLAVLDRLLRACTRKSIQRVTESFVDAPTRNYAKYLESLIYLELGVVRLIYRFALDMLEPDEEHIRTLQDMVKHLQTKFRNEYNYSLDHITPEVVADYYHSLIPPQGYDWGTSPKSPSTLKSRFNAPRGSCQNLTDTDIVQIEIWFWHQNILERHKRRLKLTGYEL